MKYRASSGITYSLPSYTSLGTPYLAREPADTGHRRRRTCKAANGSGWICLKRHWKHMYPKPSARSLSNQMEFALSCMRKYASKIFLALE